MGTWRTLYPRRILLGPGAISVLGGVSTGEHRTWVLRSGAECSADHGLRKGSLDIKSGWMDILLRIVAQISFS